MEQDLLTQISQYLDPSMMVVITVLLIIGFILKNTPKVADWLIVWILPVLGILFAFGIFGITIQAVIQGILAAAMAVLMHQMWKQTTQKRE